MKNQRNNLFQLGDSGFADEEDDDENENCEIGCERILSWRTEDTYDVFRYMYIRLDMNP